MMILETFSLIFSGGGGGVWKTSSSWWFHQLLKNISQNGNLPQIGVKISKKLKPPPSLP